MTCPLSIFKVWYVCYHVLINWSILIFVHISVQFLDGIPHKTFDIQREGFQFGCDEPTASLRRDQRHGRFWFGSLLWRLWSATKPRQRFGFALRLLCNRGEYFHNAGEGSQGFAGRNSFQIGVLWNRSCRDRRWKCYRSGYSGTSKCEDEADLGKLGLPGQGLGKWKSKRKTPSLVTRDDMKNICCDKWYDSYELIWLLTNMKWEMIPVLKCLKPVLNHSEFHRREMILHFLVNIMNSQTVWGTYLEALDQDLDLMVYFASCGKPSKYGSWGMIEAMDQPRDQAYKYQAVQDTEEMLVPIRCESKWWFSGGKNKSTNKNVGHLTTNMWKFNEIHINSGKKGLVNSISK